MNADLDVWPYGYRHDGGHIVADRRDGHIIGMYEDLRIALIVASALNAEHQRGESREA